ncbi:hypothetical protein DRE_03470 [Drechslerella stenobrocha 248]|uniref:Uncharacterized protein n=1 Tax=Drechslerella stenobrocha 248 TaxID=1043628 RepID=W7HSR6_9PEZI|nr:hypothetical protein DRE_03470 [Drechslerella stenobrocha 248]
MAVGRVKRAGQAGAAVLRPLVTTANENWVRRPQANCPLLIPMAAEEEKPPPTEDQAEYGTGTAAPALHRFRTGSAMALRWPCDGCTGTQLALALALALALGSLVRPQGRQAKTERWHTKMGRGKGRSEGSSPPNENTEAIRLQKSNYTKREFTVDGARPHPWEAGAIRAKCTAAVLDTPAAFNSQLSTEEDFGLSGLRADKGCGENKQVLDLGVCHATYTLLSPVIGSLAP